MVHSNSLELPMDVLRMVTPEDWESIQPTWVLDVVPRSPAHQFSRMDTIFSATSMSRDGNTTSLLYPSSSRLSGMDTTILSATGMSRDGNTTSLLYLGQQHSLDSVDTAKVNRFFGNSMNSLGADTTKSIMPPEETAEETAEETTHQGVTRLEDTGSAHNGKWRGEYTCTFSFSDVGRIPPNSFHSFGRRVFGRKGNKLCPNTNIELIGRSRSNGIGKMLHVSSSDRAEYEFTKQRMFTRLQHVFAEYNEQCSTTIRFTFDEEHSN